MLDLTTSLLQLLASGTLYKRLQVVKDDDVANDPFLAGLFAKTEFPNEYDESVDRLDIIMKKSQFVKQFIECYTCLYKEGNKDTLAALGVLLATPGDSTALLMLDEDHQSGSVANQDQFAVICAYLTSELERTNKASTLWTLFKKIVVKRGLYKLSVTCFRIIMMSIERHPRNYYAYQMLRFIVAVIRDTPAFELYLGGIWQYLQCDGQNDTSGWQVFVQMMVQLDDESYYRAEYVRLGGEPIDMDTATVSVKDRYNELMEWLQTTQYRYYGGWMAAALIAYKLDDVDRLSQILKEYTVFEETLAGRPSNLLLLNSYERTQSCKRVYDGIVKHFK